MPTHLLAVVPSIALIVASGGLRTDRLSPRQLHIWKRIVKIVLAEGRDGRPLHPTLRRLWEAVDTSGHVVQVEIPDSEGATSFIAGRFEVTKVDPEGRSHEALIVLNLWVVDRVSTGTADGRPGGFIPFKGLGRNERYAELLGHELAHAVWALGATERACLAQRVQRELEGLQMARETPPSHPAEGLRVRVGALEQLLEGPAEVAEEAIWKELRASRRPR